MAGTRVIPYRLPAIVICIILGLTLSFHPVSAVGSGFGFTNFELGSTPGTVCPNAQGNCTNFASEPQIRADKTGSFYASSENGLTGGTDAWKSADGGLHYSTLTSPNSVSAAGGQFSPAGGDTDLAVATAKNTNGFYNVYVASLEVTSVFVSTTKDGGTTWNLNPTAASVTSDDREWIAADGASKVCVSYRAPVPATSIFVQCSFDAGLAFLQPVSAFDSNHLFLAAGKTRIGNLAIDPHNHLIYQSFSSVANIAEANPTSSAHAHVVYLAVSIDGGNTFTDHIVYNNPNPATRYGHQFVNVSVDGAGNVYLVFSDDHNVYYSFSGDFGNTWSAPVQINQSPSSTAIMPWSVAGSKGSLDVVWYGTSFFDGSTVPDNYPLSAAWYVFFAQNLQALDNPGFTQVIATPVVHFGGVCEGGVGCAADNAQNRDLFDDFGIAASPTTGLASIIYSDDQFTSSANEPTVPFCSQSQTNTINCDRTNIATQTSGLGIIQKHGACKGDGLDFEEMNTKDPTNPEPQIKVSENCAGSGSNDSRSVTSIDFRINGLSLALGWAPALPVSLASPTTLSAQTSLMPTGFIPTVGTVYGTTITTTLSDGTTATETTNVIYSLGAGIGL